MAQFRFPLEKILRWRAIEAASEEAKLQRLIQERNRIDAMLNRITAECSGLTRSISGLPSLQGADFRAITAYGLRLRQTVEKLKEGRSRIDQGLALQQRKYAEAKRRVRLLEQLKERRLERWKYEEDRQLEILAAESFLAGWNRD
jgi:flagellar export protein FliJ